MTCQNISVKTVNGTLFAVKGENDVLKRKYTCDLIVLV
jgi:hypothetical protein